MIDIPLVKFTCLRDKVVKTKHVKKINSVHINSISKTVFHRRNFKVYMFRKVLEESGLSSRYSTSLL